MAVAGSGSDLENLQACPEEGAGCVGGWRAGYREKQGLACFHRNCVCAVSLLGHSQDDGRFLKQKAEKGREEVCGGGGSRLL